MTAAKWFLKGLVLTVALLASAQSWSAEGIISSVSDGSSGSCFLRFPAIKEETLYWSRPVLKDPSTGDVISYYGRCNYDPLSPEEIRRQRMQYDEYRRRQVPEGE